MNMAADYNDREEDFQPRARNCVMSGLESSGSVSGFAKFDSASERDRFVTSVIDLDRTLSTHTHPSASRPDIVFQDLNPGQYTLVKNELAGRGRWFDDVQFGTM